MGAGRSGPQMDRAQKLVELVPKHIQGAAQIQHHSTTEQIALETRRGPRPAMISLVPVNQFWRSYPRLLIVRPWNSSWTVVCMGVCWILFRKLRGGHSTQYKILHRPSSATRWKRLLWRCSENWILQYHPMSWYVFSAIFFILQFDSIWFQFMEVGLSGNPVDLAQRIVGQELKHFWGPARIQPLLTMETPVLKVLKAHPRKTHAIHSLAQVDCLSWKKYLHLH